MKLTLKHAVAAIVLVLSFSAPVAAGPFEDAGAAAARGDYEFAQRLWRTLANQGNAAAQFFLGAMYYEGRGVQQNYAEAAKWYRLAADQGNAHAQNNLGLMYDQGQGVPQNYAEAVRWYRLAACVHPSGPCTSALGIDPAEEGRATPRRYRGCGG